MKKDNLKRIIKQLETTIEELKSEVYSDKESMKVEPSYMHERYAEMRSASADAEEESTAETTADVSGGEE